MKKLLPIGTLGLAGLIGAGVMAFPGTPIAADVNDDAVTKREEGVTDLVLVADDDDDDTNGGTDTGTNTGTSRSTGDNTRSNVTRVSRDRDRSRSDNTRDWTHDGPGDTRTRDWSDNRTNDGSRNDTRGRR